MNFDVSLLAKLLKQDKAMARKILKAMVLVIALGTVNGKEVNIEYLGRFNKRGRHWSFKESDYFNIIRSKKLTPIEFLDCLLTEDDQLKDQ